MNDHDPDPEGLPVTTLLADRYRLVSLLGSGGMADVYLAEDERLGRRVAVKVLKARLAADDEFRERFRIEAQAAASLKHPSIVAVYDRGTADGVPYIAMEYVHGESLKQRVRRDGALPSNEAVDVALNVLSALAAAHDRSIVHRDVTSYNVLLEEGGRVVVTDFGIARMGDSALTHTGAMMGTSSYLSPEQAQGRPADRRSDLYSLGVVLYEMLTGRVPFRGDTDVAVAMQHVSCAPPNPRSLAPGASEALAAVVMQALSKDPADRYQTAEEFAAALRRTRRPRAAAGDCAIAAGALATPDAAVAAGAPAADVAAGGGASPEQSVPATAVAAEAPTRYHAGGGQASGLRPRRRPLRLAVLTLVLLAVAAAGGWAAYTYLLAQGATVPAVIGERRAVATAALRDEGLQPELHFVWSDRFETGEVVRQAPRGGTKVDDGITVDLWVSRGPLHIPSPDLGGLSADAARDRLEAASLKYRGRRGASRTVPTGQVFRQETAAGERVERGETVTFWVSSGPPRVDVPDVVGLSQGDAVSLLEEAGFVVSTDYVAGWGEFPGTVTAQDPEAGSRGRAGDEVIIQVAVF
ncbi:MAG: Stk1 family PASTA domain-containing Ser/Thr kinase [Actinobacteria bacterium]|nr:Stk1 family PASTA domain-containing Ser/Thr kinase [Actinomycetota bacterium]